MSVHPLRCEACDVDGVFERAARFPGEAGQEATYGVSWCCPQCGARSLDLCPVGPIEPHAQQCPNCGRDDAAAEECAGCGMTRAQALSFLEVGAHGGDAIAKARACFATGLFRRGFAALDAQLRRHPRDDQAWCEKGRWYQWLHLERAAIACYRRALELQYEPATAIALACAHAELGEQSEAIHLYDDLLAHHPSGDLSGVAFANRANAHAASGDGARAVADYEAALRCEPRRATHYLNYALLFGRTRKWADAEAVLSRGIDAVERSEAVPLLLERARVANEQEHAEEGLLAADAALALVADHPRALYQRAWALGMLGRLEEARGSLVRLLQLHPDDKNAARALGQIEAALGSS